MTWELFPYAVVAGLFALVCGANDGGALLATGLKLPNLRPATALLIAVTAVGVVPLIVGTRVAETFTTRLAPFQGAEGRTVTMIAIIVSLVVVGFLTRRALPTSLTLALVGGLTGAGLGAGLPVSGGTVGVVLAVGLAAPFLGLFVAHLIALLLARSHARALRHWHAGGFGLACAAYGANDGQKMIAVFMIVLSGLPSWEIFILVAVLFGLGALYGLPKAGRLLSREILASRPLHGVAAELGSGVAVLGSAAAGMPVSMTQAIAGGMVGAGITRGSGRIRWHAATKIVMAWIFTLPASMLLAGLASGVLT